MRTTPLPEWRSILFVPANVEKYVAKADRYGADAILLDLEDSIAPAEKASARAQLPEAIDTLARGESDIGVRINRPLGLAIPDIEAAVRPAVSFLALPKVESGEHIRLISEVVGECEADRGIAVGSIGLVATVESAAALFRVEDIARADGRMIGLTLGSEDFSLSCGCSPTSEAMFLPKQMAMFAARAAGILPLGLVGSVADFSDLDAFRSSARRARSLGFTGAYAIHPAQVGILNKEFSPSADEIEHAQALIAARETAIATDGKAFAFRGQMIDRPILQRAETILRHARARK